MSDLTPEDEERLDLKGVFVVDFEPGLFGPFRTRREADEWASAHVDAGIGSWLTCPLQAPSPQEDR